VWTGGHDDLVQKIVSDATFDTAVAKLKLLGKTYYATQFDLGTEMPEPDRSMYERQVAITVAEEMHAEFKRDDSFASFMLDQGTVPELRNRMEGYIDPTRAQGMQALPIMRDYQQGMTEAKARKKAQKRKLVATTSQLGFEVNPAKKQKTKT
jgi:hypothetical protein